METITIEQLKVLAKSNGLEVIEDFYISLTNGNKSLSVYNVGCMNIPPYSTLFSKERVDRAISILLY